MTYVFNFQVNLCKTNFLMASTCKLDLFQTSSFAVFSNELCRSFSSYYKQGKIHV